MSMVINHNLSASNSLTELNKQVGQLRTDLAKISSGQRINSAGDDASGFSISEKMRKQLRSLTQDISNTQTGRNLCKVAAGAIESIVEELRSMKELALNSANDTNTDEDRAIMQKEYAHRCDQVSEIAHTTNYNGRILLDGRYKLDWFVSAPVLNNTPGSSRPAGNPVYDPDPPIKDSTRIPNLFPSYNHTVGSPSPTNLHGERSYEIPVIAPKPPGNYNTDYTLDFFPDSKKIPYDLANTGFTFGCTGCHQDVSIRFDVQLGQGVGQRIDGTRDDGSRAISYLVGVAGVKTPQQLMQAVFEGVKGAVGLSRDGDGNENSVQLDTAHDVRITKMEDGTYHLRKNGPSMIVIEGFEGTITNGLTVSSGAPPPQPEALIVHTGTKANQHQRLYFNDMDSEALGINLADIRTRLHAEMSIDLLDAALEYALNEATTVGAYISRLDTTESNLTVSHENTTASESTLRDADMAKEMMEYTKSNVLSQSAQSMLAQANQNSSSVLSLLQ